MHSTHLRIHALVLAALVLALLLAACATGAEPVPTTAPTTFVPTTARSTPPPTEVAQRPTEVALRPTDGAPLPTETAPPAASSTAPPITPMPSDPCQEPPPTPTITPSPTFIPSPTPTLYPTPPGTTATVTPITIIDCADCDGWWWHDKQISVKWFVGLSTGTALEQVEVEQDVVEEFNSINSGKIYIALNIIPNAEAYNVLATQIAAGTPPDIIGPVGIRGLSFAGAHVQPLDELIEQHGVDLSVYDEGALRSYRGAGGCQLALPYMVFPSFIYFNKELFDAAGLAYPPQQFGALYEGKPWDMDALRELAMKLTLDANGNNATEPAFDPTQIVQFGFHPQWNDGAISEGAVFGAGDLTGPNNEATIPEAWKEAWRWFYRARHVDHFVPNADYALSDEFGHGNVWKTGKVAMAWTHLWYTCCFEPEDVPRWDIAVVPSYNGTTTAKLHADTFAIMRNPGRGARGDEAVFKAYMFLLGNAELRAMYLGLPAIEAHQPAYFAALDEKFAPNEVTWQVALDSLAYADVPSHEQSVPNYLKFQDRYVAFDQLRHADAGLDLDAEIDTLERDLTKIFRGR